MTTPFAALRMHEFAKRSGLALLGGAMGAAPLAAQAATGSVEIVSGGFKWFINTNITFDTTSSNFGFSEASATQAMQTENGSFSTLGDAFDGALGWHVHGVGGPSGGSDLDGYQALGGVTVSPSSPGPGQAVTVTGNVQVLQGLNVTGQLYFPAGEPVARSILILQNPSAADITVRVTNDNNLGSDGNTKIVTTSSGDNVFQLGEDNWVISFQNFSSGTTSDPTVTLAGMKQAVVAGYTDGDDNPYQYFDVTVPAGGTKRVMALVRLSPSATVAQTQAATFNDLASLRQAGYVGDLSEEELRSIVNWNYVGAPNLTAALSGPAAMTVGQAASLNLTITNVGTAASSDGAVTVSLPAGLSLTTAPAGCTASGSQDFVCTLTPVAAADAGAVPPVAAGVQTLSFSVTPTTEISAPANITATISGVTGELDTTGNTTTLAATAHAAPVVAPVAVPGLGGLAIAGLGGLVVAATARRRKKVSG
ncbi:hypothetical protein SDC9_84256 [bioreactor metagenome]|uniref:DUF11 domain-containing protein n=1 Tax=bioreactor metagenome TaxID=1076179 RepID=A0A644ZBH8_9ZZZZ